MAILKNIKDTLKILPEGTFCIPLDKDKTPLRKFDEKKWGIKPSIVHSYLNTKTIAYGIRCFKVVCVDCDLDKNGLDIFEEFREGTFKQKTGGGGFHYIYLMELFVYKAY